MTGKAANQYIKENGDCAATACSAPDWFAHAHEDIQVAGYDEIAPGEGKINWGPLFSKAHPGNSVEFFVTGTEYFNHVAPVISAAQHCVFIAGWQVNYDVELVGKKTLFHCLHDAVKNGATVYVMPWLSPKVGVDTGDFETMLAVFQLNAGSPKGRAYCLPAMQQSDQDTLAPFFSHHQKMVVVDNKKAYVGGIDLAYGRRDDGNFSLKANGRTLNELYNTCVPPIHALSNVEQKDCVTRMELLAAAMVDGKVRAVTTFFISPAGALAPAWDAADSAKGAIGDGTHALVDFWDNLNLQFEFIDQFRQKVKDGTIDATQQASLLAWEALDSDVREKLIHLRDTAGANAANTASAVLAWLNNASLDQLPPAITSHVASFLQALALSTMAVLQTRVGSFPQRYKRLFEKVRVVPKSGKVIDVEVQPRMPWQDVHCCIQGPSVYDVCRNFVSRWNGTAHQYEKSFSRYRDPTAQFFLNWFDIKVPATPKAPRIQAPHLPKPDTTPVGTNWVQLLRSAPKEQLTQEAAANPGEKASSAAQNNCLKGMLKVISGAQKFIYIEGQFFQSAYGDDGESAGSKSGPLGALMDLRRSPRYNQFVDLLGIRDAPSNQLARKLIWKRVPEVQRQAQGREFMSDLKTVMTNVSMVEAFRLLGKAQERLKNPISLALVNRIEKAIQDGVSFHVYIVVPVHPEGTLNTLNIMTQAHLTMQSLVLGKHSLVNGVRRAILTARWRKERKLSPERAKAEVAKIPTEDLVKMVDEEWTQYLTLLNLRNWDTLDKPVTEQIYVHSKLLIADDRIAILGSANINDRSQWGDRDGEMAVIVTDSKPVSVKLDGAYMDQVAHSVHDLRKRLWRKLFGMESNNRRSATLGNDAILNSPAAPATWKVIQEVARRNAETYERSFWFIPRSGARPEVQPKSPRDTAPGAPPASIWPTWHYKDYLAHELGGQLQYRMPFDELFWRKAKGDEVKNTWDVHRDNANGNATVTAPGGIEGFIVALPVNWTARENNNSGMNLTVLADTSTLPESEPASTMQRVSAGVAGDAGQDESHKESMG